MKHSKLLLLLCLILGIATYFASCEKKYDNETVYKGKVVNTVTSKPFPDLEVKVTDGEHINATVKTDENGQFSILVKFNEINGNYYLLIGDASCVQVRRDFKGFGQAEINLGDIEVEGPKSATITTLPVTNVTAESVLTGGNITDDGRAEITARGVCWSKQEYPTLNDNHTTNGTGKGEFQSEIKGLDGGETYYVRAYATSSVGTTYGGQFKFTTETGFPIVTTDAIGNVTATSAKCGGTVTEDSGYRIIACGVCWSTTTSYPTIEGSHTTDVATTGHFNSSMENLERNTTYYVRAYATNKNGTSYGETISFITTTGIPVIKTESVTNIMALSALGQGKIIDNAGHQITTCGFCWSSTNNQPTLSDAHSTELALTSSFNSTIENLEKSTTYYARAYATNGMGTGYGDVISFTTTQGTPLVKTEPATNVLASSVTGNGEIVSDSGYSITECGFCWSTTNTRPTLKDNFSTEIVTSGKFSGTIDNLEKETTYYMCAYATNKVGTSYGETVIFTTILGIPVVKTGDITNTLASSAICAGEIVTNSGYNITTCGLCWSDSNPFPTINDVHTTETMTSGVFSSQMKNLKHSTTYYVRAYATNEKGVGYGEPVKVTTISGLPMVTTGEVSNVLATSATCSSEVSQKSEYAVTVRGVCWSSVTTTPTIEDAHTTDVATTGQFSSVMNNLERGTKYYVRAYATNAIGTEYGATISFTTTNGIPVVRTEPISNVLALSATGKGYIDDNAGYNITMCGICYSSTNTMPTLNDPHTEDLTNIGSFNSILNNLLNGTTYYIRAYATNSIGTGYGEVVSFTTPSGLPVVRTETTTEVLASTVTGNGTILNDSGYAITGCGFCWSKTNPQPTINDNHTNNSVSSGRFNGTVSGLEKNTTYYLRAYATNKVGTSYGETVTFTTILGLPIVKTGDIDNIRASAATGIGEITSNSGYSITSCGLCWSSTNSMPTIDDSHTTEIAISSTFSSTMTGLEHMTTYYVRAYATNKYGTGYGEMRKFTTISGLPVVTTGSVSGISAASATCGGTVTSNQGANITACGLCWSSTNSIPTIKDSHTTESVASNAFNSTMTGLEHMTIYYVRAYATNKYGTGYGDVRSFTTISGLPVVSTGAVSAISASSAICSGEVLQNSGFAITARGVCWSSSSATPTINNAHTTETAAMGGFNSTMTNLNVSTKYYVRAYATNSKGTSYGATTTFTTLNGLPTVATTSVGDNMTQTTILTGGQIINTGGFPITARGVVWWKQPNPTINRCEFYTTDGSGSGSFSSQITNVDVSSNTYYIRAYATNVNGTSYGEQLIITPEDYNYSSLMTMQISGYTYKIYLKADSMTWYNANSVCNNLTYGGYSDWVLPTQSEGQALLDAYGVSSTGNPIDNKLITFWLYDGSFYYRNKTLSSSSGHSFGTGGGAGGGSSIHIGGGGVASYKYDWRVNSTNIKIGEKYMIAVRRVN